MSTHQSLEKPPITSPSLGGQLQLDPGAPERKPRSATKVCLWLTFTFLVIAGCSLVHFIAQRALYGIQHPHSNHYHPKPESEVTDWSPVVRPLITKKDSFDIIASVWAHDDRGEDGGLYIDGEERPERLIFSKPVFRNVNLKGKTQFTNVTLRVPVASLRGANISTHDLRASFVLVHSETPSWLTDPLKFTTWKPDSLHSPSVRLWKETPSVKDQIYDSFGVTIPLIQFHNAPYDITASLQPATANPAYPSDLEGEYFERTRQRASPNNHGLYFLGDQRPVGEHHPYIITRTDIGIMEETNLYDHRLYALTQQSLAMRLCVYPGIGMSIYRPLWYQCTRAYGQMGVFETKIQAKMAESESSRSRGQYMHYYAPHLTASFRSPGPKDLIPVPLGIKDTTMENDKEPTDEEFIEVGWRLSFSTHRPTNSLLLSALGRHRYNMTETGNDLEISQYLHETSLGIMGFRSSADHHPRLFAISSAILLVLGGAKWVWNIIYWYTRSSTVGISRFGNTLLATSLVLATTTDLIPLFFGYPDGSPLYDFRPPFQFIVPLLMLKAIFRLEFTKSWYPRWYFAQPTHLERASERIETRISKLTKLLVLSALFTVSYVITTQTDGWIFKPDIRLPMPTHPLYESTPLLFRALQIITRTLSHSGFVFQLIMNTQSKTYAGKYKINARANLIFQIFQPLLSSRRVFGSAASVMGYPCIEAVDLCLAVVDVVQSLRYKTARGLGVDESEQ
ncbi:hypothetical protein NP233_g1800 [Leucocoprinus birnbaumii]|uniref:Uncharacterized protein n=1 Tax=Leucocoprinus birnbaumii TaxID=56174 RepID=A0AAD5W592_9AGAR|nr:hypothetical protein NP233_g1800 [Leucocoprinus birnbaumii]